MKRQRKTPPSNISWLNGKMYVHRQDIHGCKILHLDGTVEFVSNEWHPVPSPVPPRDDEHEYLIYPLVTPDWWWKNMEDIFKLIDIIENLVAPGESAPVLFLGEGWITKN